MKTCNLVLTVVVLLGVMFAAGNSPVFAQSPCLAQVGYPTISTPQYYGTNVGMTMPVYATCSYYNGQLYAVGSAYDTVLNSNLGSVSTPLYTASIGSFNGQLVFNLPGSAQGHTVQFTVSIYSSAYGYGGSPLATTYQAVTVNGGYPYYQNGYSCQPGYSYGNSCYSPGYGYNNYNTYCPPGYSYNGPSCSYPGSYYYTTYYSHGNYYRHWYYHHNR